MTKDNDDDDNFSVSHTPESLAKRAKNCNENLFL